MRSLRFALTSLVLLSAVACGSSYSSPSTTPSPAPSPAPGPVSTPAAGASPVTIPVNASTLTNTAFAPDAVDVSAGGTVTWTNSDGVAHTSTSDTGVWDSGIVQPGGQFSVSFPTAGTYRYRCLIHPGMVGTVVVH
jgi:plastocyanin